MLLIIYYEGGSCKKNAAHNHGTYLELYAERHAFLGREALSSLSSLDAGGVHLENPRELLDVPHILRKLKMRRYEGHLSDQKAWALQSAISLPRLHQTGLTGQKKKSCCQRPVVETFAGGAELLRRWGRCLEARVAALPLSESSASARQPSSRSSSSAQGPVPRRCCQLPNDGGYSTSS